MGRRNIEFPTCTKPCSLAANKATITTMTKRELQDKLYDFMRPSYPDIEIRVKDTEDDIRCIYFIDEKFKVLYPKQRYHYLVHLVPDEFYEQHLRNTTWFELAPGEHPNDLAYHDEETIEEIKADILLILKDKVGFVSRLDDQFTIEKVKCYGDFGHAKQILSMLKFSEDEQFDIFHVLMQEGAFCDCEILYNVFRECNYAKQYWRMREAEGS